MSEDHAPGISHPRRLDVLEAGHSHLVDQMADMVVSLRQVQQCLVQAESRMTAIETELRTNSQTTSEVRDILSTARGAFRFFALVGKVFGAMVRMFGLLAAAGAIIYAAAYALIHGGNPPAP